MQTVESNDVRIHGHSKHIRQLEDNVFASTGVRVILTLPTNWEIFVKAEEHLSKVLKMDETVKDWKTHFQSLFQYSPNKPLNAIGLRGLSPCAEYDLPRHAIVFVQPDGKVAHARKLIRQITFKKGAVDV